MRIEIKSVDPSAIRYNTCGDWQWLPDGSLLVNVPDYGGQHNSAFLVAVHEMVEAWLCKKVGLEEEEVSAWDKSHLELEEPGDHPSAPYHQEHVLATAVERKVCAGLRLDWNKHNDWVGNAASEVDRRLATGEKPPRILMEGSRYWAELHLFALRTNSNNYCHDFWLQQWILSLPFDGCPCEQHLKEFLRNNPAEWHDFFAWTIKLHNSVNERIGKDTLSVDKARELWKNRSF